MPLILNFALYPLGRTFIQPLFGQVDGYPSEEHEMNTSSTEFPVEDGSSITDNVIKRPDKLQLTGWVSDITPFPGVPLTIDRSTAVWGQILAMMNSKTLITVITHLRVYNNMIINRVRAPVNRTTGRSLRFTIDLREIIIATTEQATFSEEEAQPGTAAEGRQSKTDRGEIAAPKIPPEEL